MANFPSNPVPNQHFTDGNRLWVWNYEDSTWDLWGNLNYVPVPGEKGTDGAVGQQGDRGPTGPRGPTGSTGEKGDDGGTGTQG